MSRRYLVVFDPARTLADPDSNAVGLHIGCKRRGRDLLTRVTEKRRSRPNARPIAFIAVVAEWGMCAQNPRSTLTRLEGDRQAGPARQSQCGLVDPRDGSAWSAPGLHIRRVHHLGETQIALEAILRHVIGGLELAGE